MCMHMLLYMLRVHVRMHMYVCILYTYIHMLYIL